MDAKKLYEKLDNESRGQLKKLAEEIQETYGRGEKAGQFKGKVILFLGAAVNYHAPDGFQEAYAKSDRPPLGNELTNLYIDDLCSADTTADRKSQMMDERLALAWV